MAGVVMEGSPVNPVLDYDFGQDFIKNDLSGTITREPPRIVQVIPTYVPRLTKTGTRRRAFHPSCIRRRSGPTSDGTSLRQDSSRGEAVGSSAATCRSPVRERTRNGRRIPDHLVEERYGTLEGYVCVVERAARQAVTDRFLLQADADRLIAEAKGSGVWRAAQRAAPRIARSRRDCAAAGLNIREASPLGLPDTRPRSPLRRLPSASAEATADALKRLRREGGPVAWLARDARSRCYPLAISVRRSRR